jgi:hypothetical protein
MMGDTVRITRVCTLEGLSPELATAIRGRMTPDDATISICCETHSTTMRRRMLGRRQVTTTTGMIVTPRHLIWAVADAEGQVSVISALLRDLEVHDYESSDHFRLIPDSGLTIDGLRSDLPGHVGSAFIAVGPEPAGAKFRRTLRQAIADANLLP